MIRHTGFIIMISRPQAEQEGRIPKSPRCKGAWGCHPQRFVLFLDSIWWLLVNSREISRDAFYTELRWKLQLGYYYNPVRINATREHHLRTPQENQNYLWGSGRSSGTHPPQGNLYTMFRHSSASGEPGGHLRTYGHMRTQTLCSGTHAPQGNLAASGEPIHYVPALIRLRRTWRPHENPYTMFRHSCATGEPGGLKWCKFHALL